jgi:pimeloyl-ACP methyl ester carboxylesterase
MLSVSDGHRPYVEECGQSDGLSVVFLHGRNGLVCPLEQAWALHKVWPQSRLQIIQDAGHSATEQGIIAALLAATNQFSRRFR